jgi:hypothetical protein
MNHNPILSARALVVGRGWACVALMLWVSATSIGQTGSEAQSSAAAPAIHVVHILGFEGARQNASGELRIQGDAMQFQQRGNPAALVTISSIQNVFVGGADKQVGGTAMTLSKAAVPFGGGRVVSLFSHKKYDSLTVEYLDINGGFHGAIFQLNKGQAQTFKDELVAKGIHVAPAEVQGTAQSTSEVKNENK